MGAVVVFCEVSGGALRSASLPALTAAAKLASHHGGPLVAAVIGAGLDAAAKDAARYAARVISFDDARLASPLAET
jgi:electron transfer flavoprotein alpha subunit